MNKRICEYSKMKNNLGAAMVTTGCGGTNAVTGVFAAWQDNLPCIYISGQVKKKETTRNIKPIQLRNFGVQEADIVSVVESITKYATMINNPESIYDELRKAYEIAISGCPGPVWLDIPLDVQGAPVTKQKWNFKKNTKEIITPKNIRPKIESMTILNPETKIIVIQVNINNKVCPRSG